MKNIEECHYTTAITILVCDMNFLTRRLLDWHTVNIGMNERKDPGEVIEHYQRLTKEYVQLQWETIFVLKASLRVQMFLQYRLHLKVRYINLTPFCSALT